MRLIIAGQPCTVAVAIHRDGTCSYLDPRSQRWIERARTIPQCALDILTTDEAARVRRAGIEVVP